MNPDIPGHRWGRGAIHTAVADLLPERTAGHQDTPAPELPVTLAMPGKVTDFLLAAELEPAVRATLDRGVTPRRGQGYPLCVAATPTAPGRPQARRVIASSAWWSRQGHSSRQLWRL
ncbi:hypothetical protein [Streptomyces sp. NPDC093707]|uniref:hypothetical protein n=1 Tax=Streptomyces sp. NPDC093707 TaxID=3154984 RepID=UPI0034508740